MNIYQYFYLSLTLLLFANAQASDAHKVTLKNNTLASASRVEEVWQSLQKIDDVSIHGERFWLWRTCLVAKKLHISLCDVRAIDHKKEYLMPLSEKIIQKFDELAITQNGILDEETCNIVLSSYSSSIDGKFCNKHYPTKRWYESIPGFGWSK